MSKVSRLSLMIGCFLLIGAVVVSSASAQRRFNNNQGGNNQNNNNQNNNSNKNKDKDDDDNDRNNNRNGNNNSQQNNNQNNNQGGNLSVDAKRQAAAKNAQNNNQNNNQNGQQLQDLLKKGQNNNNNDNNNDNDNNNRNRNNNSQNPQQFPGNRNNKQYQNGQQGGLQIGNVQVGDWQKKNWQGSHKIDYWNKQYNNGPQVFSSKWYESHPNAWYYNHPHSDVWVVATIPGVYSWLGWGNNYPQGYVYDNSQQQFNPEAYGEWYPLGVYSMVTGPGDNGTRIVQLSVDREGNVNGTYYDLVMDTSRQVSGRIRQSSQNVSWSLNSNPQLTFNAPLNDLMQPQGVVMVQLPGGEQEWQLIRLQNN